MSRPESLPLPDYEPADASPRLIVFAGGLLALGLAVSLGAAALLYANHYRNAPLPRTEQPERSFRHGTEAKTSIARAWEEQDRLVREHLYDYGWVDRQAGVVHIPIDRALDLLAAESAVESKEKHP